MNQQLDFILKEHRFFEECSQALGDEDVNWEVCYEKPPKELRAVLIKCFAPEWLASAPSPQDMEVFLKEKAEISLEEWDSTRSPEVSRIQALGVLLAACYDLECLSRHGVHMHDLLKSGATGNDKAFFRAMEIDSAVAACKPLQKRFMRAVKSCDQNFLKQYALKLKASIDKNMHHQKKMRLFFHILDETHDLDKLGNDELHSLFMEVGALPDGIRDHWDSVKTAKQRWKKSRQEHEN